MDRRSALKLSAAAAASLAIPRALHATTASTPTIEKWGLFETSLTATAPANPFDVDLAATFTHATAAPITVRGFYDGDNTFRIRFMPPATGEWRFTTRSTLFALDARTGSFTAVAPNSTNHGPVAASGLHFCHADGTWFHPFGTTCYAWTHQTEQLETQTLATLVRSPFNKVRMCLFPKSYEYVNQRPPYLPFLTNSDGSDDHSRFNPDFFRHQERRIAQLGQHNIQADLILFHPYDRWDFSRFPAAVDDRYLRYTVARFGAFRNLWWSLANEFDLLKAKSTADWDRLAALLVAEDPYAHLRSVHYSKVLYDYAKPWCTHASLQSYATERAPEWRAAWQKPIIYDEMMYEGDLPRRWGNLSGQEMTFRFWRAVIAGCYASHGETFLAPDTRDSDQHIMWAQGGIRFRGTSPERIGFLRRIVESAGPLTAVPDAYYPCAVAWGKESEGRELAATPVSSPDKASASLLAGPPPATILYFFDFHQPAEYEFPLPKLASYRADLIDPWAMTITPLPGTHSGKSLHKLPARPYMALRFRRA